MSGPTTPDPVGPPPPPPKPQTPGIVVYLSTDRLAGFTGPYYAVHDHAYSANPTPAPIPPPDPSNPPQPVGPKVATR